MKIFTIGFTQKSAKRFFDLLIMNHVDLLIDVRLNNKSQLAGFAKYPDLVYFLEKIGQIAYEHDQMLAPTEDLLKRYRNKDIAWNQYEAEFETIMTERKVTEYILERYSKDRERNICLLCSEPTADQCHRRLIANHFSAVFQAEVYHL